MARYNFLRGDFVYLVRWPTCDFCFGHDRRAWKEKVRWGMGLYEGLALELKEQVIAELRQALAEKDLEIAHLQDVYTKQRHKQEDAYQQLMAQALLFAECLSDQCGKCRGYEQADCTMHKAQAFLEEHQS